MEEEDETSENNNGILIQVDEDDISSLAAHILATSSKSSSLCSIYRVPTKMREKNEYRFDPDLVSIGPYNYKKRTFKFTEEHKKRYMQGLFSRSMPPTPTTANYNKNKLMKDIIKAIKDLEVEARACYAETIHLSSDDFVTMMVVDGCFILELLYKYIERVQADGSLLFCPEDKNDPAFHGDGSTAFDLLQDLLLLENQLPIIVLNCLFQLTRGPNRNATLNQLIIASLKCFLPTGIVSADDLIQSDKHILDLLRNSLLGSQKMHHRQRGTNWAENCATDLREVGIKFKAKENAASSLDITFSENDGVLEIPRFHFGAGMDILIPNIIALEHSDLYSTYQIRSYALLLKILIKSEHDVELLARQGVIDTMGEGYQVICNDIKDLGYGVKFRSFYYDGLCNRMDSYCRSDWMRLRRMWHKWKEMLKREYFGSPWAVISFSAAVVLLGLTLTQTIYSIKSYSPARG